MDKYATNYCGKIIKINVNEAWKLVKDNRKNIDRICEYVLAQDDELVKMAFQSPNVDFHSFGILGKGSKEVCKQLAKDLEYNIGNLMSIGEDVFCDSGIVDIITTKCKLDVHLTCNVINISRFNGGFNVYTEKIRTDYPYTYYRVMVTYLNIYLPSKILNVLLDDNCEDKYKTYACGIILSYLLFHMPTTNNILCYDRNIIILVSFFHM